MDHEARGCEAAAYRIPMLVVDDGQNLHDLLHRDVGPSPGDGYDPKSLSTCEVDPITLEDIGP